MPERQRIERARRRAPTQAARPGSKPLPGHSGTCSLSRKCHRAASSACVAHGADAPVGSPMRVRASLDLSGAWRDVGGRCRGRRRTIGLRIGPRGIVFRFYLGPVMAHDATNRCSGDAMVTGNVSRHAAYRRAFNAPRRIRDSHAQRKRRDHGCHKNSNFHLSLNLERVGRINKPCHGFRVTVLRE